MEVPSSMVVEISNYEDVRHSVAHLGIPYHVVNVQADTKVAAEAQINEWVADCDVLVLARYMQIIPPSMCAAYPGQIINIHHSFLPSFIGAKPYHQAWERGVKLIGATCHYITTELDQGPIIEQDVIRIDHSDTVEDLVRSGKDIEKTVLARGLRYHIEDSGLLQGNKKDIFRS